MQAIADLLHAANKVAREVCTTTLAGTNSGQHYINRPTSRKRQKLTKQLNTIKCLKSHLNSVTSSAMSFEELEEQYPENHSLNCAEHDSNNFMPEHIRQGTLHQQIWKAEYHINSKLALIDKTLAKECHQRERKKQQKTIDKEQKKPISKSSQVLIRNDQAYQPSKIQGQAT